MATVVVVLGLFAAVGAAWLALVIALVVAKPDAATLADAVRVLPDTIGLVRRLS